MSTSSNDNSKKPEIKNVIIIGSGPAGYCAAIYCGRACLNPLMITGKKFGGLLMDTSYVENFPGFSNPIYGPELMEQFHLQAESFGTEFIIDDVTEINRLSESDIPIYKLTTFSNDCFYAYSIIISTGSSPLWLNAENESDLRGSGISTCATCDGSFFKKEDIIVVGGGDSAFEEALFLTRYANTVTIVHRKDSFKASASMIQKAKSNPKIKFKTPYNVISWVTDKTSKLSGAVLQYAGNDTNYQCTDSIQCAGAFIAIGHKPNTHFLPSEIALDKDGYILVSDFKTSLPGIFASGDVVDRKYKQAITAAGDGCKCALEAFNC